jgi:hypothetical protein
MGQQGPIDAISRRGGAGTEGGQPHDDPRGAEAALAATGGDQGAGPALPLGVGQAVQRRDLTPLETPDRRDTGHTGGTVHPDRAAAALALRTTAVLYRADAQVLTKDIEERRSVVGHLDIGAVDTEPDQRLS